MIGKLTGVVDSISADAAIIDVNGVGYVVHASGKTLARLGARGTAASLLIDTHVREDAISLFGFAETVERDWFRALLNIQGVGAKVALSILSVLAPDELARAIAAQDKAAVARANGVGPKLAQRVVSEMKDKAGGINLGAAAGQWRRAGAGGECRRWADERCGLGARQSRLPPRGSLRRRCQGDAEGGGCVPPSTISSSRA